MARPRELVLDWLELEPLEEGALEKVVNGLGGRPGEETEDLFWE